MAHNLWRNAFAGHRGVRVTDPGLSLVSPEGEDHPAGPVAAGQVIGLYLRRLRNETGLPLKDVAAKADMSVAKLSRLERGVNPPKAKDVFAVLEFFGVVDEVELAALEHLLAQTLQSEWWQEFSDVVPGWLSRLLATESAATQIRTYQCHYVPGLLQTPDYARAVVQSAYDDPAEQPQGRIQRFVQARLMRQQILSGPNPPVYSALLDEGVLWRPVGGVPVFREQLRHLYSLAENRSHVSILIVPFQAAARGMAPNSCITYLKFMQGGAQELIYLEQMPGGRYINAPVVVEEYRATLMKLTQAAVDRETSMQMLREAIDRLG